MPKEALEGAQARLRCDQPILIIRVQQIKSASQINIEVIVVTFKSFRIEQLCIFILMSHSRAFEFLKVFDCMFEACIGSCRIRIYVSDVPNDNLFMLAVLIIEIFLRAFKSLHVHARVNLKSF